MEPAAGSSEVLDHGRERPARPWARAAIIAVAAALAIAAIAAGVISWSSRPPTSAELSVIGIDIVGPQAVTVYGEPPVGALTTPSGTTLPGVELRARVGGDPERATEVLASRSASLAYVEETAPTTIAPGGFVDLDLTMAPVDCTVVREDTDLDEAGYRWRRPFGIELIATTDGVAVPLSDAARGTFVEALARACRDAGEPPELTVVSARRGGESPLETIGLVVDAEASADRLVLTPLDGPGLRGLGSADRDSGERIPLLWLVSPRAEHNDEVPTAYTQVFVVRGGTAYPWIVGIPITDDLPAPLTPLRSVNR